MNTSAGQSDKRGFRSESFPVFRTYPAGRLGLICAMEQAWDKHPARAASRCDRAPPAGTAIAAKCRALIPSWPATCVVLATKSKAYRESSQPWAISLVNSAKPPPDIGYASATVHHPDVAGHARTPTSASGTVVGRGNIAFPRSTELASFLARR
jgi:hypothetical protein